MLNILFVDDEPNVLSGLQRMLHSMKSEWNMTFLPGGNEALSFLQENPVNIIVSDMKMPGMDGAELLKRVRVEFPNIIRMVLSGYAESEMIMRSVAEAHQYMSKPCDSEKLKSTIEGAVSLHGLLSNERLRLAVTNLNSIPSVPSLYVELMGEMAKEDPSMKVISSIIENDIGMTVKTLQIVNSAFFSLPRTISDAAEAVKLLGLDTIASLALAIGVFSKYEETLVEKAEIQRISAHSMTCGSIARNITRKEMPGSMNDAFTAGLLHDIGRLVLAANFPVEYKVAAELSKTDEYSTLEAENEVLGATHAEIGAYLLSLWGLPRVIVEAAAFHHTPGSFQKHEFSCLTAVHLANAIESSKGDPEIFETLIDRDYLNAVGVSEKIDGWRTYYVEIDESNSN